jgi:hypothetical protein
MPESPLRKHRRATYPQTQGLIEINKSALAKNVKI